jgi:hypothetical protein
MTFSEKLTSDAANTFLNTGEFAETVAYTPSGGSGRSISAVIDRQDVVEQTAPDGSTLIHRAVLSASRDATAGIPSPSVDDTFTFDSATWKVDHVVTQDDAMVSVSLVRIVSRERSSQSYRKEQ